jgi:hypothetical protein
VGSNQEAAYQLDSPLSPWLYPAHNKTSLPTFRRSQVLSTVKEWLWRCFETVFWALTVTGTFVQWVMGIDDGKPRAGQQCGPAHHWVYPRSSVEDPDLSCEAD